MKEAKYLLISTRPKQWYKNTLLFVAIVFSANILNISMWATVILAFVFFCMLSSGEYLINDVLDRKRDREHPVRCKRPIASEQLRVSHALPVALVLIVLALLGSYLTMNTEFVILSASFVVLGLLYSFILKHIIIADVLVIAVGFVIRAAAGALAIDVFVSPWLIICTFLLALFLSLGKRWSELVVRSDEAKSHRASLSGFTPRMLEQLITTTTGALIVSYLLYTTSVQDPAMLTTIPFAVYGLFRYLYLVHKEGVPAEPEVVFKDKAMLINLGIWILLVVSIILYRTLV